MSEKNNSKSIRSSNNKKTVSPVLWIGGIVVGVIVILALLGLALAPRASSGTPQLQVDTERIDLGVQPFEKRVSASFQIRNAGTGALTLSVPRTTTLLEGC